MLFRSRILLDGVIPNVQVSWVKLGLEEAGRVLAGGANDLGGTLMEETISRMAGSPWGIRKEAEELETAIRSVEKGRLSAEALAMIARA